MANKENSALAQALMSYLDCPCTYYAPMRDDDPLMEAFREAQQRGKAQGFTPVIVAANDDVLMEALVCATDSAVEGEDYAFDIEAVRAFRRGVLSGGIADSDEVFGRMFAEREAECEADGEDYGFDGSIADSSELPEVEDRFFGYWDYASKKTMPVIIAEIPTDKPWEIFAWLPFGGWNECPDAADMMAVSKSWYDRYGAVPSVITHDVLDYELSRSVPVTDAMRLAREQFGFCPDVIYSAEEDFTAGTLAASLMKARFWTFWWD